MPVEKMNSSLVGLGFDSHRFMKGRPLFLGGVLIPFPKGLRGHSDADVLLHAVIDALLGAAGLGDIGSFFPDSDPRTKNVSSLALLRKTADLVKKSHNVLHVDMTLLAEAPKLGSYKARIRAGIARVLGVPAVHVNVKAKTNEGMGFVGRGEGLAAMAVATLTRKNKK